MHQTSTQEMAPHAIDHRPGKKRIVTTGQPASKPLPRIVERRQRQIRTTQWPRRNHSAGTRMTHLSGGPDVDLLVGRHLSVRKPATTPHPGKHRRQPVVVGLAPGFKRVVMALGTLDPHAQECLRDAFDIID